MICPTFLLMVGGLVAPLGQRVAEAHDLRARDLADILCFRMGLEVRNGVAFFGETMWSDALVGEFAIALPLLLALVERTADRLAVRQTMSKNSRDSFLRESFRSLARSSFDRVGMREFLHLPAFTSKEDAEILDFGLKARRNEAVEIGR